MIKDKYQKQMAVRFCATQGIVPYVEVVVRSRTGVEENPADITDIDVVGVDLSKYGGVVRTIFDCKSGSKLSAINRGLWAGGLRQFVNADRAFVIQKREVPYSHKIAANTLNVHLHTEDSFEEYAASISIDYKRDSTYLADMDLWDVYIDLARRFPAVADLCHFANNGSAMEAVGSKGVRYGLSALLKAAPELDPAKQVHHFLFANTLSAFLVSMAVMISGFKEIFRFDMSKEEFESTLRYFVWEGKENYSIRSKMKSLVERARGDGSIFEFELPEWEKFINMARSFLDAPDAILPLAYLAKEMAFRGSISPRIEPDTRLRNLFESNKRARQFIFSASNYLVASSRLPREFSKKIEADINTIV